MATEYRQNLEREYKILAHRADERLRALERLADKPGYEHVLDYAYNRARKDTMRWGREDVRFGRGANAIPTSTKALEAKLNDVKTFLESATSTFKGSKADTKHGIRASAGLMETMEKRAKSFNKSQGTSFSAQTLKNYFDSDKLQNLESKLGYKTVRTMIGKVQTRNNQRRKAAEKAGKDPTNLTRYSLKKMAASDEYFSMKEKAALNELLSTRGGMSDLLSLFE